MTERLRVLYKKNISRLITEFSYKNIHQIPKIEKIVINFNYMKLLFQTRVSFYLYNIEYVESCLSLLYEPQS